MITTAWTDIQLAREKSANGTPIVTIFGAGVAGLSLAHELVERGFAVQVIEKRADPDEEYRCLVGGMAANQDVRISADVPRLHPYLYHESPGSEDGYVEKMGGGQVRVEQERGVWIWVTGLGTEVVVVRVDDVTTPDIDTTGLDPAQIAQRIRNEVAVLPGYGADLLPGTADPTVFVYGTDAKRSPRVSVVLAGGGSSAYVRYEQVAPLGELRAVSLQETQPRFPVRERLQFQRAFVGDWRLLEDDHGTSNDTKLQQVIETLQTAFAIYTRERSTIYSAAGVDPVSASERMREREILVVEIRAHTESSDTSQMNRARARLWGEQVRQELLLRNVGPDLVPNLDRYLVVVPVGDLDRLGNPRLTSGRRRSNRVEFRIVENLIPGEHGYRFFPRFYRHLFDTMHRTPILDDDLEETGETAFERLMPTDGVDLAFEAEEQEDDGDAEAAALAVHPRRRREPRDPESVPVRIPRSIEDLRMLVRIHLDQHRVGITERDILRFQFKLFKFLTASSERRRDWEKLTWQEFLGADDPGFYSEKMREVFQNTPQALAAMNAEESDARTMGTVYCQLLLDSLGDGARSNMTLNGPTSAAWLDEWKRYLTRQGVRFFCGTLEELVWIGEDDHQELLPVVLAKTGSGPQRSFSVVVADPRAHESLHQVHVDRFTFEFSADENTARDVIAWELARQINREAELPATADRLDAPLNFVVVVESQLDADSVALIVDEDATGSVAFQLNSVEFVANGRALEIRESLLSSLRRSPLGNHAEIERQGNRGITIAPKPGQAIVSIASVLPGEYGVRIDGVTALIDLADVPDPPDIASVRDQLLARIVALRGAGDLATVEAEAFGHSGIVLRRAVAFARGTPPISVDVRPFEPRMHFGPILRAPSEMPIWFLPGGHLSVAAGPGVGILGAEPEVAQHELVTMPLTALGSAAGGGPDFYVLALDYGEASRLVWQAANVPGAPELNGVFKQLTEFDVNTAYRNDRGALLPLYRDGSGRPVPSRYPLRDLSGIQYYFENYVRVGKGHTYFMDAPWGLSSIAQLAYWRKRMSQKSAFVGQLSVDIGDFYQPQEHALPQDGDDPEVVQPSAWRAGKREIALETWNQVKRGLGRLIEDRIVPPRYWHLDDGVLFEEDGFFEFGRHLVLEPFQADSINPVDHQLILQGLAPGVADAAITVPYTNMDAGGDLANDITRDSDHLAERTVGDPAPFQVMVAPVAANATQVRILVARAAVGINYRVSVNRNVASFTATTANVADVRDGLVGTIMTMLPGVIASGDPEVEHVLELHSSQPIRVSVLAVDPGNDPSEPLLRLNPTGSTRLGRLAELRVRDDETVRAAPARNATPYMINGADYDDTNEERVRVFGSRPGIRALAPDEPFDPRQEISYALSRTRWMMVGTHMATHTRVTSMEAANESARHAVISILHALMDHHDTAGPLTYNGQGPDPGRLLGSMPELWDPEEYEIDQIETLKRLDARLMQQRDANGESLPHFLDILRAEEWIENLPELRETILDDERLSALTQLIRGQLQADWEPTQLDEAEQAVRSVINTLFANDEA